jgi:hypothetical protein
VMVFLLVARFGSGLLVPKVSAQWER